VVRYIRIAPHSVCSESITVQVATVKLPEILPADFVRGYDLCNVDSARLNRKLQRQTHTAAIDDSVRFGIVASCGPSEIAIHLPYPELVRLESLRKKSPQVARWWDLQGSVKERAFGTENVFYQASAKQDVQLEQAGETMIAALRSGRFDKGLYNRCNFVRGPCKPPSFGDELQGYAGPAGSWGPSPRLSQASQYRFKRYVDPKYPPLAMQARIQGTVTFDLSVDPSTGRVQQVNIVRGHPLFREAVMAAARLWEFEPDGFGADSNRVPAELVFEFRCPEPIHP
jgi:TonB family C-terminal domain